MLSKPFPNQDRVGLPILPIRENVLNNIVHLSGLPPTSFKFSNKSHSIVRACDDIIYQQTMLKTVAQETTPGFSVLMIGPDIDEIKDLMALRTVNGAVFKRFVVTYLDIGKDAHDPGRFNVVDPYDQLSSARFRSFSTCSVVNHLNVAFVPFSKLNAFLDDYAFSIAAIFSRNSWVSGSVYAKTQLVERICINNLSRGDKFFLRYYELLPLPEELKIATTTTWRNALCGYTLTKLRKITTSFNNDPDLVSFTPSDIATDVSKTYIENLRNWIDSTRDFWCGKDIALAVEEKIRIGCMVFRVMTPVFKGTLYSVRHAPMYTITLPVLTSGFFCDTFRLMTGDADVVLKYASMLAAKDSKIDYKCIWNADVKASANAYNQIVDHMRSIATQGDLTIRNHDFQSDHREENFQLAVSLCAMRNSQNSDANGWKKFLHWLRVTFSISDIGLADYAEWIASSEISHLSLATLGFSDRTDVSSPLAQFYRPNDCFAEFCVAAGLPVAPPPLINLDAGTIARLAALFANHPCAPSVSCLTAKEMLNEILSYGAIKSALDLSKPRVLLAQISNDVVHIHWLGNHSATLQPSVANPFVNAFLAAVDPLSPLPNFLGGHPHFSFSGRSSGRNPRRIFPPTDFKNAYFEVQLVKLAVARRQPLVYRGCGVIGLQRVLNLAVDYGLTEIYFIDLLLDSAAMVAVHDAVRRFPSVLVHLYTSDAEFLNGHEVCHINPSQPFRVSNDPGPMPPLFRIPNVIPPARKFMFDTLKKLNQKFYDWVKILPTNMVNYFNAHHTLLNPPHLFDAANITNVNAVVDIDFVGRFLVHGAGLFRTDNIAVELDGSTYVIDVNNGDTAAYARAYGPIFLSNVPDATLFSIRERTNHESVEDYHAYVGELVLRNGNSAFRVRNTAIPAAGQYILYDDAYFSGDMPVYTNVHAGASAYIAKLHFENNIPDLLNFPNQVYLYTCPTGSSFEFRFGNYTNADLQLVSVDSFGVSKIDHADGSVTYQFDNLVDTISESALFTHDCTECKCYIHTIAQIEQTPSMMVIKNKIIHGGGLKNESRLTAYLDNNLATQNSKFFQHQESLRLEPISMDWFNAENAQAEIFKFKRNTDADFTYKIAVDPLFNLEKTDNVLAVCCIAGFGKTKMLRSKKALYISPYKKVVTQNAEFFKHANTFEVGVDLLLNKVETYDYIVIDEAHGMGPLLFFYAEEARKRNIRLFLLGDRYQIPWACRTEGLDEKLIRNMEYYSSPNSIFNVTSEVSYYSRRFGPQMAKLVSAILGVQVIGLNQEHTVAFHFCNTVQEVHQLFRKTNPLNTIVLTKEMKSKFQNSLTATESGGSNDTLNNVILLGGDSPLPYKTSLNGRLFSPHEYVALTRSCVHSNVYLPINWNGIDRNNIILAPDVLHSLQPVPVVYTRTFGTSKFSGFDASVIVNTDNDKQLYSYYEEVKNNHTELRVAFEPKSGEYDVVFSSKIINKSDLPASQRFYVKRKRAELTYDFARDPKVQFNFELKQKHKEALFVYEQALRFGYKSIGNVSIALKSYDKENLDLEFDSPFQTLTKTLMGKQTDYTTYTKPRDKSFDVSLISHNNVRSADEAGKIGYISSMILFGSEDVSFFEVPRLKQLSGVDYDVGTDNLLVPFYDEYLPTYTTGQFHSTHLDQAEFLIRNNYDVAFVQNKQLFIGQQINFTNSINKYAGANLRYNLYAALTATNDRYVSLFCVNPAVKFQYNTSPTNLASTLSRYGKQPYKLFMDSLPPLSAHLLEKQHYDDFGFISTVLANKMFIKMELTDTEIKVAKHAVDFAVSQSSKGTMVRTPTVADLYKAPNIYEGGMKVQTKHADTFQLGNIYSDKAGQPVQVMSSGWMTALSPLFRFLTEILHKAMGPRLQFMGPDFCLKRLWAKLAPHVNWDNTIGGDLSECDASHIPIFVDFVRLLILKIYPNSDLYLIESAFTALSCIMDEWFCRSRDSTYKVQVLGQLASGCPWTFLWNCLWSLFNFSVLICETKGRAFFERLCDDLVLGIAGDDFFFSTSLDPGLVTQAYINSFRVTIKISVEPRAVIFCHNTFTAFGVFPDPLRTLSKFLSKPIVEPDKELTELKVALNDLYKDYRDGVKCANLVNSRVLRFNEDPFLSLIVLDLIFRICNTPVCKLKKLLTPVRMITTHFV